jgi:hypothetical protein
VRKSTVAGAAVVVAGYSWFASALRSFTLPALIAVIGGGVVAVLAGTRLPPLPAPATTAVARRGWVWAALAAGVASWELQSFAQHPRHEHPTLSSLTNTLLQSHWSRAAALVAWLVGAAWLARR